MLYEVHFTVEPRDVERWHGVCAKLNLRPVFIENSGGLNPRQLMCEAQIQSDAAHVKNQIAILEQKIKDNDFQILRTKVECPLGLAPTNYEYYECHMKFYIPDKKVALLKKITEKHPLFLSRSLIALNKWYLTARYYHGSKEEAARLFMKYVKLIKAFLPIHEVELEAAIYDSNPDIDEGWIPMVKTAEN